MNAASSPRTRNIIGAGVFWAVAIALSFITSPTSDQPTWVWVVRIVTIILGLGWLVWLSRHEKSLKDRGTPVKNDTIAVDLWTVAHTMAGVVMGAWALPLPLVLILTIVWEFFEGYGGGIGKDESLDNRIVDVVVAVMGWIVLAGITTAGTGTEMPWLLPAVQSLVR
jgi:hypothetical protein